METEDGCTFCNIEGDGSPVTDYQRMRGAFILGYPVYIIEPPFPHVPGHRLIVPKQHYAQAHDHPRVFGELMAWAASWAGNQDLIQSYNLVQSNGTAATQTINHMHVHVLPRGANDGTDSDWPWMRDFKKGDRRPHSRACGISQHEHGPACSTNCPTCGGK